MRPLIPILLVAALAAGGCDRQSGPAQQANDVAPVANAAAGENAGEVRGTVDRSHKGEAAPDFAFTDAAGKTRTVASFAGKPVLVNLWATWCAPCVKEMPTLDALAVAKGDALHVLTISQDTAEADVVTPFFAKAKYRKLQPYRDRDAAWSLGLVANLPTTLLYDSAGKEVWRVAGDMDWTSAEAAELLAEAG